MQAGELIVTNKDKIEIVLKSNPTGVSVKFKDHHVIVPCNPRHFDELKWEVLATCRHCKHNKKHYGQSYDHHGYHKHHMEYTLLISWSVTAVRDIVWAVFY